jgi:hypothetical protein
LEQIAEEQEELIRNCDAVIWISKENEEMVFTIMSFFRSKLTEVMPTHMGYKYNIMTFRTPEDVDTFTAIIGDPKGYVERLGKIGYHGIMFKKNAAVPSPEFKSMLLQIMDKWGFSFDESVRILHTTVE